MKALSEQMELEKVCEVRGVSWCLTRGGLCAAFRVLLPPPWPQAVFARGVQLLHGEVVDDQMVKQVVRQAEAYFERHEVPQHYLETGRAEDPDAVRA